MPRNVRNFWLEIYVDGRKTLIKTGPRGKDGGFMITIFQRENGEVRKAGEIYGVAEKDGTLELSVRQDLDINGKKIDELNYIIYRSRR